MSEQLLYKTEAFEGPLDLLLSLIAKNKLNIYDIPIAFLIEQYISQIELMQASNMEVAAEFLDMAARLVHIKSVSLLPKHEEEEEELKRELTGSLLEYRLCKIMAGKLMQMYSSDKLVKKSEKISIDNRYTRIHQADILTAYYFSAVGRGKRFLPAPLEKFSGIISHRVVSVASQVISVLRKLFVKGKAKYSELFTDKVDRSEKVATFLALLALVKDKRVIIEEENDEKNILLVKRGHKVFRQKGHNTNE